MIKKDYLKNKIVIVNVVTSGLQIIIIGVIYLFLYRFLLKQLGIELLGVWSIVLSTSSLANLANFGVTDSVIRFVALYSQSDGLKMKKLIFTASLFLFMLFGAISLMIYPFADLILNFVLPIKFISQGKMILPFSLLCLTCNSVNGVFASVLDGLQKNYLRNVIFSCSSIILLVGGYYLVPKYGLLGIAFAQLFQSLFTILLCLINVIFIVKYNPFAWNWDRQIFKQIFNYGMKFQVISLAAMLNDPVTKLLLGKFGGMAYTGYYEMANRLVMQARGVIVSATQSLIPVMVKLPDGDVETIGKFYKTILSNIIFFSVAAMSVLILSGHYISIIWLGKYQETFHITLVLLSVSLFVNILNTPAYFFYMAKANLNILIKTHLILGLSNVVIGFLLGKFFGGYGVISAWFFAVVCGSLYPIFIFNKQHGIPFLTLFKKFDIAFVIFNAALILVSSIHLFNLDFKTTDIAFASLAVISSLMYFLRFKYRQIL